MTSKPQTHATGTRARYLDITKGLAILCIVLLHFSTGLIPRMLNIYIGTFMITTFYITAGWVDSMKPQAPTFRARVTRLWHQLGVPYVIWTVVILLFDVLFWAIGHYDSFIIIRDAYKSLCLRGIGTLWFLPALFGGQCLWWWMRRMHRRWLVVLSVVVLYFYGFYIGQLLRSILPGLDPRTADIVRAPFTAVGSMINAYVGILCGFAYGRLSRRWRVPKRSVWLLIPAGCLLLALGWFCAFSLPKPLGSIWHWIAPNVIPFGVIVFFMALETSPVLRYFDYWGRNSMALMVTHMSILLVIADVVTIRLAGHRVAGYGWHSFATFCAVMVIEYFLAEWLRRCFPRSVGQGSKPKTLSSDNAKHF